MLIEEIPSKLSDIILNMMISKKLKKKQYQVSAYLYWSVKNFYTHEPDKSIRIDFKSSKNECYVFLLDDYGISLSMEGNDYSENGHDSYSKEYVQIHRNDTDDHYSLFEFMEIQEESEIWLSEIHDIFSQKKFKISVDYEGEFKMDNSFVRENSNNNYEEDEDFN